MAEFIKSSTEVILHQPSGGDWDVYSQSASIYFINLVMHIKGVDGPKELKLKKYHTKAQGETYFLLSTNPDVDSNNATDDAAILTQDLAEDEYRVCAYAQKVQKNDSISSEYSLIKPASSGYGGYRWQLKSRMSDGRHTKVVFDAAKVPTLVSVKCGMWGQHQYGSSCEPFVIEVAGFTAKTTQTHTGNYVGEATLNVPLPLNMLVKRDDGLLYTLGGAGAGGGNFVTTDKEQLITGKKTFSKVPQVTTKPAAQNDVATVGYVSGLLNAKAPYDVTLDFKVESKGAGNWVVYSNMEINLDNGKKLKCIHIDNTQPTVAGAPVKAVFKAIPADEAINEYPTEQAPTFFDTYQLQDEEYLGTLTYGHILNSQLQDYSSYKGPFHTNQYGTTCTIEEATQLRIILSELPAAVSKVSLKFDGSYLPKTFKASMSGVGIDVTSNVLTNPSGNTPLELLFDVVKLTGLVTLDTAQTITGAKTFEVLPKSEATPKDDKDLITKAYLDATIGSLSEIPDVPVKHTEVLMRVMQDNTNAAWACFNHMKFFTRSGKTVQPLYIENTDPNKADAPIQVVYTLADSSASGTYQDKSFFDSYSLKEGEFKGTITFSKLCDANCETHTTSTYWNPYNIYSAYDKTDIDEVRDYLKFTFEKLPSMLGKVEFTNGDPNNQNGYISKEVGFVVTADAYAFTSKMLTKDDDHLDRGSTHTVEFEYKEASGPLPANLVTLNTQQELTALKTFKVLPQSEAVPADDKDLVNKKYVDEKAGGGGGGAPANMVTTDTAQNITEVKTFDKLPKSSVEPTDDTELVNKKYVDDASKKVVTLADAQTITGVKTFNALPQSSVEPAADTDLVNKKYVDAKVGGGGAAGGNVMTLDTEQTVTAVKQFQKLPRLADNYAYILPTDPKDFVNKAYVDTATKNNSGYELTIHGAVTDAGKYISFTNVVMTLENGDDLVLRYYANDEKPGQVNESVVLWSYGDTGKTYGSVDSLKKQFIYQTERNHREILGSIKLGTATVHNQYNFTPAEMTFTSQKTDEQPLVTFKFDGSMPPITKIAFRSSSGDYLGKSFRISTKVAGSNSETSTPNQTAPTPSFAYKLNINPAFVPEPFYINRFQEQDVLGKIHFKEIPVLDKPVDKFGLVKGNTAVAMADLFNSIAVPVPKKQAIIIGSKATKQNVSSYYRWTLRVSVGDLKLTRKNPNTLADEELFLKFCGPSADGYKGVLTTKKPENYLNPVVEKAEGEMNQYKLLDGECWCKLAYKTRTAGKFSDTDIRTAEAEGSNKLKDLFAPKTSWFSQTNDEYNWDPDGGPKAHIKLYIYDSALVSWTVQKEVTSDPWDQLEVHGDKDFKSYYQSTLAKGNNYPKDVPDVNLQTTNILGIISALEARVKALEEAAAPKPQYKLIVVIL